jgi:Caspase domain
MHKKISLLFLFLFFSFFVCNAQVEHRKALLIGNKDYITYRKLKNSIKDVEAMNSALKKLGFETTIKKDLDYRQLNASINSFLGSLNKGDVALVYYSGHGIGYEGYNYILPIEENLECLSQLEELKAVSVNKIVNSMETKGVKNSFIFLDACRNIVQLKDCSRQKAIENGGGLVIPKNNPEGNLTFYATGEGRTADDDTYDENNSLFTSELLKYITEPDLSIRTIVDKVTSGVELRSNKRQIPQKLEDLRGDFYFIQSSPEEIARKVAENKKKQEDEIRSILQKEIEAKNKLQVIPVPEKPEVAKANSNINEQSTFYQNDIRLGNENYNAENYKIALKSYQSAKTIETTCTTCTKSIELNQNLKNVQHNIQVINYKHWKGANKVILGLSLVGSGFYTKYYVGQANAKSNLTAKQQLADPDGDKLVYLSTAASNNTAYNNYLTAYKKLESFKEVSTIQNILLGASGGLAAIYVIRKVRGKEKPSDLKIIPFSKGLSLSYRF